MSSRTANGVPSTVNSPAACSPPVAWNTDCLARKVAGRSASTSAARVTPCAGSGNRVTARTSSSAVLPRVRTGTGRRSSTSSTL
ncbi:Uncharacterised protein [Mycobacteroides abscessus subsp. abscessus]|nr:Uncharacterised protein [Mycobacteroides abscessus subsp. abscessus]